MTILPETHQKDMNNMLINKFYADLVVVCGSLRFHVHRFMVTAGSQAFNRLLNIDFSDMGARSSSESSVVSSTTGDNVNNADYNEETEYLIRCDPNKMPQPRYVRNCYTISTISNATIDGGEYFFRAYFFILL